MFKSLLNKFVVAKQEENMMKEIAEAAGQIWHYLDENGEVSLSKMRKDLDLAGNFTELGLGWLAREDKVDMWKNRSHTKVRLR